MSFSRLYWLVYANLALREFQLLFGIGEAFQRITGPYPINKTAAMNFLLAGRKESTM